MVQWIKLAIAHQAPDGKPGAGQEVGRVGDYPGQWKQLTASIPVAHHRLRQPGINPKLKKIGHGESSRQIACCNATITFLSRSGFWVTISRK
jgi:hypothetical protein